MDNFFSGSLPRPRKRFGQNFLQDPQYIHQIIEAIHPKENDRLIEIGPGRGALTQALLNKISHLNVIELDRDLVAFLAEKFKSKLSIHAEDALAFDFSKFEAQTDENGQAKPRQYSDKLRVVGNLPYNISTPLIFHLLQYSPLIQDMHFMLQKEVVDRLVAHPGTKAYGRMTVMVQYFCKASLLFLVPPEAFFPKPKVMSAFVRLQPYEQLPYLANDLERFQEITKAAFQHRRKTLQNTLKHILRPEAFAMLQMDPQQRAENLSVQDFVNLSNVE